MFIRDTRIAVPPVAQLHSSLLPVCDIAGSGG